MNQTNTTIAVATADLLRGLIGRQVESKSGIMLINDVLTHKTGVLKDGSSAPYLHLVAEMGDKPEVDLHPQKAMELLKKGESGAYKILGELAASGTVSEEVQEVIGEVAAPGSIEPTPAIIEAIAAFEALPAPANEAAPVEEKKESKKAGTLRIYAAGVAAGKARKDIIAQMRTELDLSVPGANTYYQNCKSGMWK